MRKRGLTRRVAATSVLLLLCLSGLQVGAAVGASTSQTPSGGGYPSTSWALGVVLPEGSGLQGGGSVRWEDSTNVTVVLRLPNISDPDRIVYAVMSVMAQDGSVMQAATGVYPNSSVWLAYSWFIPNVQAVPLEYVWLLNSSEPQMAPGARVAISIFRSSSTWELGVLDEGTGSSVYRAFPASVAPSLKPGDQEVFALESYSRAPGTFQSMGNLTMASLLVDGRRVTGGFYTYADWDPNHEPVFGVGSAGTSPPSFVSLQREGNGSFEWSYAGTWASAGSWYPGVFGASFVLVLLLPSLSVVAFVYWMTSARRRARRMAMGRSAPSSIVSPASG